MNRLFIETPTHIFAFFSTTKYNHLVQSEWSKIQSFTGIEKTKILKFINTEESNQHLGNLHCFIKNTLNYTTKLPLL